MTGPHTQLTHHYNLLQYDHEYEHELLMTNGKVKINTRKQTQNPFIYQNYSKYKIMKNLARTCPYF